MATQPAFLAAYKPAPACLGDTQRPGFLLNTHTRGSAHSFTGQGNLSLLSPSCRYRYLDSLFVLSVNILHWFVILFYFIRQLIKVAKTVNDNAMKIGQVFFKFNIFLRSLPFAALSEKVYFKKAHKSLGSAFTLSRFPCFFLNVFVLFHLINLIRLHTSK